MSASRAARCRALINEATNPLPAQTWLVRFYWMLRQIRQVLVGACMTRETSIGKCSTGKYSTGEYSTGKYSTGKYSTGEFMVAKFCIEVYLHKRTSGRAALDEDQHVHQVDEPSQTIKAHPQHGGSGGVTRNETRLRQSWCGRPPHPQRHPEDGVPSPGQSSVAAASGCEGEASCRPRMSDSIVRSRLRKPRSVFSRGSAGDAVSIGCSASVGGSGGSCGDVGAGSGVDSSGAAGIGVPV